MICLVNVADVSININLIAKRLRLVEDEDIERITELCNEAIRIAKPKFIYKISYIDNRKDNSLELDGIKFTSRLISKNFESINRVFPFAATCGTELHEWASKIEDVFEQYWVDYIMEYILRGAIKELYQIIEKKYGVTKIASMNPGSLAGWPINQQKQLFQLLDEPTRRIGIELKDSYLMIPNKSLTGILFPSKSEYVNCKLCDRKNCQSRRAIYDKKIEENLLK